MLQVYTGNGKGKTTAAIGQAIRALGQNKRVLFVQFLKHNDTGEFKAAMDFLPDTFYIFLPDNIPLRDIGKCKSTENYESVHKLRPLIVDSKWDMIVLDEVNILLKYKYITQATLQTLIAFIDAVNDRKTEIICTGRGAPQWLIDQADYVTHMREVKHPFLKGIHARKGIEY
jgi:cob(I)alamin adenosyltransferase